MGATAPAMHSVVATRIVATSNGKNRTDSSLCEAWSETLPLNPRKTSRHKQDLYIYISARLRLPTRAQVCGKGLTRAMVRAETRVGGQEEAGRCSASRNPLGGPGATGPARCSPFNLRIVGCHPRGPPEGVRGAVSLGGSWTRRYLGRCHGEITPVPGTEPFSVPDREEMRTTLFKKCFFS